MSRPVTDLFPVSSVFRPDRRMNYGPGMPTPPIASTRPVTTTLHGVERADPYAWIADPDGTSIVLVQVPPEHPLRRDTRAFDD